MGNCLMNNGASAKEKIDPKLTEAEKSESKRSSTQAKSSERSKDRMEKVVRVKLEEDDDVNSDSAKAKDVVRLRIVLSAQDLNKILDCKKNNKHLSVEQLLDMVKISNRRITESKVSNGGNTWIGWRPALESIPEDN